MEMKIKKGVYFLSCSILKTKIGQFLANFMENSNLEVQACFHRLKPIHKKSQILRERVKDF